MRFEQPQYFVNEGDVVEVCLIKDLETPGILTVDVPTSDGTAESKYIAVKLTCD